MQDVTCTALHEMSACAVSMLMAQNEADLHIRKFVNLAEQQICSRHFTRNVFKAELHSVAQC